MKRILCYGDSNVWGSMAFGGRYPHEKQWPQIARSLLGEDYWLLQEGLCARCAGTIETEKEYLNGQNSFEAIYRSAAPVDFVLIALGTNDFKSRYQRTAEQIRDDLLWYANKVESLSVDTRSNPEVVFITPANFEARDDYFNANPSVRTELIALMKHVPYKTIVLDDLEMSEDGVHYSESAHRHVAEEVSKIVKEKV